MVVLKCVIVYLARDIPAFVMYCINGESGSSLLIVSTDSMIHLYNAILIQRSVIHKTYHTTFIKQWGWLFGGIVQGSAGHRGQLLSSFITRGYEIML